MLQEIIAFIILALAVGFLVKKYFFKKKKSSKSCSSDDCGCH
ncbi:FeoB-associated Cys-rich membrane protein [Flavobacterium frigidarium]|jgi:large-conductance mechanosensitive channel|nr:FeoB-associated Cys-rich membrane protein [Flavobacterium frigidarium]